MADGNSPVPALRFFPMPTVIEAVSAALGVPIDRLRSRRGGRSLTAARQVAALLMLEYSLGSRLEISLALGLTERGGAGYNLVRAGKGRLAKDDQLFRAALEQARQRLLEGRHV